MDIGRLYEEAKTSPELAHMLFQFHILMPRCEVPGAEEKIRDDLIARGIPESYINYRDKAKSMAEQAARSIGIDPTNWAMLWQNRNRVWSKLGWDSDPPHLVATNETTSQGPSQ